MRRYVCVGLLFLAGCFNFDEPDCSYACTPSTPSNTGKPAQACPDSYECRADGYCHKQGSTAACGFSDAAVSDQSAVVDLSPAADLVSNADSSSHD